MANERQPYKVWTGDRKKRKSVVVSSLQELKNKGSERLQLSSPVDKVVLEEDGTEVEDEDYFSFLEKNTTFLLMKKEESWSSSLLYARGEDYIDGESDVDVSDSPYDDLTETGEAWRSMVRLLRRNVASIVTLSDPQLEELVRADESQLHRAMGVSMGEAQAIQQTSQRYLDDRAEARDAKDLLQLMSHSRGSHSPNMAAGDVSAKRPRTGT